MSPQLNTLTANLEKRPHIDDVAFQKILEQLNLKMPEDYLEFMKTNNGGEGLVGKESYLNIWRFEDLIDWNKKYNVEMYAPGYFIFASDGGGTAYAFNIEQGSIVSFQFVGMLIDDEPTIIASDFAAFLTFLHNG